MTRGRRRWAQSRLTGFTLLEVLVVIAIIALLAAILLPSLKAVRADARRQVCLSNLRQIGIASADYARTNGDYYPGRYATGKWGFRRAPGQITPGNTAAKPETYGLPALYNRTRVLRAPDDVWICPSASARMKSFGNTYAWWVATAVDPREHNQDPQYSKSGWERNPYKFFNADEIPWVWDNYKLRPYVTGVPCPGIAFAFELPPTNYEYPHLLNKPAMYDQIKAGVKPEDRHNYSDEGVNALFFDGHVSRKGDP